MIKSAEKHFKINKIISKIEKYINIDELIFDISIFAIFFGISYALSDYNGRVTGALAPDTVIAIFILMEIFSPWYFGEIYTRYKNKGGTSAIYRSLSVLVLITGLILSVLICFYIPFIYITKAGFTDITGVYFLVNFIFGTLSIVIGWEYGTKYKKARKDGKEISDGIFNITYPLLFVLIPFLVIGYFNKSRAASLIIVFIGISTVFNLKKIADRFFQRRAVKLYFFPFILCFVMELSQTIIYEIQYKEYSDNIDSTGAAFSFIVLMLIIVRLLLLFAPPVRLISFVIGIASMIAYALLRTGILN